MDVHFLITLAMLNIQDLITKWSGMSTVNKLWEIFGFFGQAAFASRFIFQWIVSERAKRSIIPTYFWFLSILGGLILFIYAIHINSAVFIVGQGSGLIVYSRNLVLINKHKKFTEEIKEQSKKEM